MPKFLINLDIKTPKRLHERSINSGKINNCTPKTTSWTTLTTPFFIYPILYEKSEENIFRAQVLFFRASYQFQRGLLASVLKKTWRWDLDV